MSKKNLGWILPLLGLILFAGVWLLVGWKLHSNKTETTQVEENLGGRSGPLRDIVGTYGTPTASTTAGELIDIDNDITANQSTTTVVLGLLQQTDAALVTIQQPLTSSTNSFYWHLWGSNDWECANAIGTSTEDDSYNPIYPLVHDIRWYNLLAVDVTPSGYDNAGIIDKLTNATGTSILLTDLNWDCLRTDYSGASTTVLMQIKEKINTIQ